MDEVGLKALKVNRRRLMDTLHHTYEFGKGQQWGHKATDTGMKRLSLSDSDKQVRDWFVETTESLGCIVPIDKMGNIFAPTGGRYAGILGVLAGVEMLKVLQEANIGTEHPVGVVNWTKLEGACFPMTMLSSGVWAEAILLETAHQCKEISGTGATLQGELKRRGYIGEIPASYRATPMGAHFELHIEKGPVLEMEKRRVGVVSGIQAYKWYTIELEGRDAHTGTISYEARADALLGAAR
ncbi:hypothetical protein E8E11_005274 [Didymella keratinophila]|nr:hypothetical protein E8E11_005274 [Didymella keratinophila]